MRWLWLDRFTEFQSGSHASAIKNVALDEEAVDNYCPGYTFLPPTLIIEGIAQLGGILVSEHYQFEKRVVLAKVGRAVYYAPGRPGDQLHYTARLDSTQENGAFCSATSHCDGKLQAEIDLMFAFLDPARFGSASLFNPGDLLTMLRLMNFYDVAVDAEGQPLEISANL